MTAQPRQRFPISERRERPQEPQTLGLTERRAFNASTRISRTRDSSALGQSMLSAPQSAATPLSARNMAGPRRPHQVQPLSLHGAMNAPSLVKPEVNELDIYWSSRVDEFYSSLFRPAKVMLEEPAAPSEQESQPGKERRQSTLRRPRNLGSVVGLSAIATNTESVPLRAKFHDMWSKGESPAWGKRTSSAWGGMGWHCKLNEDGATVKEGWTRQAESVAAVFDERHEKFSLAARVILTLPEVEQRMLIDDCALGLHCNRYNVQPLRIGMSSLSPRSTTIANAQIGYKASLALTSRNGGPLLPIFERKFQTEVVMDEEEEPVPEEEPEPEEWTLYGSIWGPRCEWCHARDFLETREVLFERFANDWAVALRLGLAKTITQCSDGVEDADGDGVPDEMEDVASVLFERAQMITYLWFNCSWQRLEPEPACGIACLPVASSPNGNTMLTISCCRPADADAVYSQKDDLEIGMKKEQGWKAFNEDAGIWEHLKGADQVQTHGSIYIEVDKTDVGGESTIMEAIRAQPYKAKPDSEPFEAVEDATRKALEDLKTQDYRGKPDRQISRFEFTVALVKTAAERFYKSKKNPKNEMDDISDAIERLFTEFIEPSLFKPLPGNSQPLLPLPDDFRKAVCYREDVSLVLRRLAPSLRVLFAGLAKISFEKSRTTPPTLPKIKPNKKVERERTVGKGSSAVVERGRWVIVQGHITFTEWRNFCVSLDVRGLSLREVAMSFVYSRMCVVDTTTNEGYAKEYTLPFEGFLEALCRLATVMPLPTEAQLAASEFTHAGPFMATLETDQEAYDAMAEEQNCEFGDVPDPATCGPMPQRIEHLNDVVMRKIKGANGPSVEPGAEDDEPLAKLTRPEVRGWASKALGATEKEIPPTWVKEAGEGE